MTGYQGNNVLDFGSYLSIILLDSQHTHPIEGAQTHWLFHTLEKRQHIPHKFALYQGSEYGIGILLKDPIPEKILIHDTTFNIDKFQENSLVNYKSDLYFPYFSKRSFQELQNFQTSPILSE
jgi:hypothetical protein